MPPRTRAGAGAGGDDGDDESTLLSIVEMNKLFKDVVMFTPQSGVHDTNKALFRAWTRSILLHAPVLEIVGRHAKADFGDIYDDEWAKIDQSERPQAAHMLAYFLKTKTAATAGAQIELMTWRNLKMIYVRAVAPQPAPARLGRPRALGGVPPRPAPSWAEPRRGKRRATRGTGPRPRERQQRARLAREEAERHEDGPEGEEGPKVRRESARLVVPRRPGVARERRVGEQVADALACGVVVAKGLAQPRAGLRGAGVQLGG